MSLMKSKINQTYFISRLQNLIKQLFFIVTQQMSFFKFPVAQDSSKTIALVLLILCIAVGGFNIAHGALTGQMVTLYNATGATADEKFQAAYNPAMAYFIIAGAVFLVVNVVALLVHLQVLGKSDRAFWGKLTLLLLIIGFGFQFCVGVKSSLDVIQFKANYKQFLTDAVLDTLKQAPDSPSKTFGLFLFTLRDIMTADAVIAFLVGCLACLFLIVGLLGQFMGGDNSSIRPKNQFNATQQNIKH